MAYGLSRLEVKDHRTILPIVQNLEQIKEYIEDSLTKLNPSQKILGERDRIIFGTTFSDRFAKNHVKQMICKKDFRVP